MVGGAHLTGTGWKACATRWGGGHGPPYGVCHLNPKHSLGSKGVPKYNLGTRGIRGLGSRRL